MQNKLRYFCKTQYTFTMKMMHSILHVTDSGSPWWVLKGMSLSGRPGRFFHPKERHFAVVDAILYPPKVSSERVVDDVGTDGNKRRNGS